VRQTLFNWLGQRLDDLRCLDAFAGSGALGFEAASRGAREVVMCETDRAALTALHRHVALLNATQCRVMAADVMLWLDGAQAVREGGFDVVFCDPPFAHNSHAAFLHAVKSRLNPEARVYVESPEPLDALARACGYCVIRESRAGRVFFGIFGLASASSNLANGSG
jgi:16S rRNA (guanine(966)-N(2))-methyltransferase RsmD